MNTRLSSIRHRRERLVQRVARQRREIRLLVQPWRRPLAVLTTAIAWARQPVVWIFAAVLLLRLRKTRLLPWIGRAATAWQLYRTLRAPR